MTVVFDEPPQETPFDPPRRNRSGAGAAALAVVAALLLVVGVVQYQRGSDRAEALRASIADLSIFLDPKASDAQVESIRRQLLSTPAAESIEYYDHDKAYAEFREMFKNSPESASRVTPADLPTSFRVVTETSADADAIEHRFRDADGVVQVAQARRLTASRDAANARAISRRATVRLVVCVLLALVALALGARVLRSSPSRKAP